MLKPTVLRAAKSLEHSDVRSDRLDIRPDRPKIHSDRPKICVHSTQSIETLKSALTALPGVELGPDQPEDGRIFSVVAVLRTYHVPLCHTSLRTAPDQSTDKQ